MSTNDFFDEPDLSTFKWNGNRIIDPDDTFMELPASYTPQDFYDIYSMKIDPPEQVVGFREYGGMDYSQYLSSVTAYNQRLREKIKEMTGEEVTE